MFEEKDLKRLLEKKYEELYRLEQSCEGDKAVWEQLKASPRVQNLAKEIQELEQALTDEERSNQ